MKKLNELKVSMGKKMNKARQMVYTLMAMAMVKVVVPLSVHAERIKPNTSVNVENGMGDIIGLLVTVTRYIGVGVLVYGGYELAMSFTQDMPDKKAKGIAFLFGGLILVAIKSVLKLMGVI